MAKLFVYGVNARCPRDVLENEFSRCGEVTDVYITEKGYAFVTMAEDASADEACKTLNGQVIDGQEIKVDRARGGDRRGGGRGEYKWFFHLTANCIVFFYLLRITYFFPR